MLIMEALELTDCAHETTSTERPDGEATKLPSNGKDTAIRTPRKGRDRTSVETRNAPRFEGEFPEGFACLLLVTRLSKVVRPFFVPAVEVRRAVF